MPANYSSSTAGLIVSRFILPLIALPPYPDALNVRRQLVLYDAVNRNKVSVH
jgi:hypothetical protein